MFGNVHGIHLPALRHLSGLVARHSGAEAGRAQPIAGRDVFTHESGIHVAGFLKSRDCYEGLAPGDARRGRHRFVVGERSAALGPATTSFPISACR